jgi:hypothetical protein
MRPVGLRREPPMDAIGTHAVHSVSRHTEATHLEALALLDELLGIGRTNEASPAFRALPAPALDSAY